MQGMKARTERYKEAAARLPREGQQIIGYQEDRQIIVYQAYNDLIADYALENQSLGGPHYNYNRMSWIKTSFLWMMYRCGWAAKENQERVLAIWLHQSDFETILEQSVYSAYNPLYYDSHDTWKNALNQKEVRLQWDPDHDPFGGRLNRRAIQIGMKGSVLEAFGRKKIRLIEDITGFVKEQKAYVAKGELDKLLVPVEKIYNLNDEDIKKRLGIDG